jgi:hypothetical protein
MSEAEKKPVVGTPESVPKRLVCGTQTAMPREHREAGRPPVNVTAQKVTALRDAGLSWRAVARRLHIGTATAMRLYGARQRRAEASQNSRQEVGA